MYPKSLGPKFLEVYQSIVERRLKAKRDAAECANKLKMLRAKLAKLK
jgi:hypothetical protein